MSLEKAIKHGKERRHPFTGGKAVSCHCRNHGLCSYCESNRTHFDTKYRLAADEELAKTKKPTDLREIMEFPDNDTLKG